MCSTWLVCLMTMLSPCFYHHHHHHLLLLLQGRPQMPCFISEGILPVRSCSSSSSDYFVLLICNTLDESSWIQTLYMFIPSNFISLNSFKTKYCQAFILIMWSTSVWPGMYVRKFYCTVSVILMSAVFNIHCVIKVKHCISPSFIYKYASSFTALLPMP